MSVATVSTDASITPSGPDTFLNVRCKNDIICWHNKTKNVLVRVTYWHKDHEKIDNKYIIDT